MIMSVQELIDTLNKVEDKSKEVLHYDYLPITRIEENDYVVLITIQKAINPNTIIRGKTLNSKTS